jgi:hypothetical protein
MVAKAAGLSALLLVLTFAKPALSDTEVELKHDARKMLVSGAVLTSIGGALVLSAGIMLGVEANSCGPHDDCQGSLFLIPSIVMFAAGGAGLLPGIPLLIVGGATKHRARLITEGKLLETPPINKLQIRRSVYAGATLGTLSIAALAGASVGILMANVARSDPTMDRATYTWFSMMPISAALFAVASPLLLASYMKTRRAMGERPADRLAVAGWILYSCTLATFPVAIYIPYAAPFYSVFLVSGVAVSIVAGKRAFSHLKTTEEPKSSSPIVVPFATGIPGGFLMGITGTF